MIQYTYILEGRIPAKKDNQRIVTRKTKEGKIVHFILPSLAHEEWHKNLGVPQIREQWQKLVRPHTVERCESIYIKLFYGDLREKDNTNTTDSIHDLLVDCNIIAKDSWQHTGKTTQDPFYRPGKPGAEVVITVSNEPPIEAIKKTKKVKV